ncbi:MAG: hypothetical protein ACP5FH_01980 [Terracidiphilus sp.]
MHIHGNSMTVNTAYLYTAAQNEKATAAERAAHVRKKLLRHAGEIEDSTNLDESLLIGKWMDTNPGQARNPLDDRDE